MLFVCNESATAVERFEDKVRGESVIGDSTLFSSFSSLFDASFTNNNGTSNDNNK